MSGIRCQVLGVRCQVSGFGFQVSGVTFFFLSGGDSRGRVISTGLSPSSYYVQQLFGHKNTKGSFSGS